MRRRAVFSSPLLSTTMLLSSLGCRRDCNQASPDRGALPSGPSSQSLDAGALDQRRPFLDVGFQSRLQLLGRAGSRLDAEVGVALLHLGDGDDLADRLVEGLITSAGVPTGANVPFHDVTS